MDENGQNVTVADFLQTIRVKRGLTQREAAGKLGIVSSYICKMEKSASSVPIGSYQKFVEAYSMTEDERNQFHALTLSQPNSFPSIRTTVIAPNAAAIVAALLALPEWEQQWVIDSVVSYAKLLREKR